MSISKYFYLIKLFLSVRSSVFQFFAVYLHLNKNNIIKMNRKLLLTLVCLVFGIIQVFAKLDLPQMFQDGMVLQRGKQVAIWGTANANESITILWKKKQFTSTADENGQWKVMLPSSKAGGPFTMEITTASGDKKVINEILVGDVWMVSGQSNIDVPIERVYPQYSKDIEQYSNDNIRLFRVQRSARTEKQTDVIPDRWRHANKKEAWDYSAVGYFLAREMYQKTGVPQGIICNSVGGSPIQAWIDIDSIKTFSPEYYQKYLLYTDPEYVRMQNAANQRASDLWTKLVDETDPGIKENWTSADYDDSNWMTVNQYKNSWARKNGRPIVGTIWLRQHINVDKAHAGKPAKLLLGRMYDMDYTYINGKQVGVTYYQYPPRRYDIPEGLLKEGDNVITVRFVNKGGMMEFFPEKPYKLVFGDWTFDKTPELEIPLSEEWKYSLGTSVTEALGGKSDTQNQASVLYNAMLCPVGPYTLNGVVWYQGESNTGRPQEYGPMLRMLMANWRARMENDKLPFVIVQLANHMMPSDKPQPNSGWAILREQQRLVANADANARIVTAIDLGETYDIHPLKKQDVAQRCAAAFGNMVWGEKNPESPQPVATSVQDSKVVISVSADLQPGEYNEFELAGIDGVFHNAKAVANAKDNTIIVTCDEVKEPVKVRYAWKDNPLKANCFSKVGLPILPFEINTNN